MTLHFVGAAVSTTRVTTFLFVVLAVLLSACASGYQQFYRQADGATPDVVAAARAAPPPSMPIVERAPPGDPDAILDFYAKRGFNMIGNSVFNSGRPESDDAAIRQAQDVGADLVLILNPRYTGSITSALQISRPVTTTANVSGTAIVFGARGPVTAYGSGTVTTSGMTTDYIPVTTHRLDFGAIYFVKRKYLLGVRFRDLEDSERQQLQTNKGAVVTIVVDGTPAFDADILPGDVIAAIEGVAIAGPEDLSTSLEAHRGKTIAISILRGGRRIEKSIRLNA